MGEQVKWTARLVRELKDNMASWEVLSARMSVALLEAGPENCQVLNSHGDWEPAEAFGPQGRFRLKPTYDPYLVLKVFEDLHEINVPADQLEEVTQGRLFRQNPLSLEIVEVSPGVNVTRLSEGVEETAYWEDRNSPKLYSLVGPVTSIYHSKDGYAKMSYLADIIAQREIRGKIAPISYDEFHLTLAQYREGYDRTVKDSLQEEARVIFGKVQPLAFELNTRLAQLSDDEPLVEIRRRAQEVHDLLESVVSECKTGIRKLSRAL